MPPDTERTLSGWIFETNLRPFCEAVAEFAGYAFDDSDWLAVETALPSTDVDQDTWYDYPLHGPVAVTLHVAAEPGSSVVVVKVTGRLDDRIQARIEAALFIFATWHLT
ncbi:hypothetical protein [Streptomyces sp. KAU_LT]|uniref:hypothetical protein n=1 Tax=Streptomyces sp. KAU_LT TaxID=3046669 RepID=UPI0024B6A68A|nr:hypothetical protein [Streptomyces sp. KAU_LT]MDI9832686.1 hypothetical protein [Streptomyces sp. KAU_LT]